MAKSGGTHAQLLRWTDASLGDDVGDPLGLELRVGGRLLSQLLHCITSITPRARYYSFLPWCVSDYRRFQRGTASDRGLTDAIRQREKALALGCVSLHEGDSCEDGGVVGSREAQRRQEHSDASIALAKYRPDGSMAWDQYFGSLRNLGMFALAATDETLDEDERELSIEDLDLSEVGRRIAEAYEQSIQSPAVLPAIRDTKHAVPLSGLVAFAKRGGLCEIRLPGAIDQPLLRDLFFNLVSSPGESHRFRRHSLLLMMYYIRQLGPQSIRMDERAFADLICFGEKLKGDTLLPVKIPDALQDIRARWRMFYAHYYTALALEGMFKAVVAMSFESGRGGLSMKALVDELDDPAVLRRVGETLGVSLKGSLLKLSVHDILLRCELGDIGQSDGTLGVGVSEPMVAGHLRRWNFGTNAGGLAASFLLLGMSLLRYRPMHDNRYGSWLANNVRDPQLDLAPPVLIRWLERRSASWSDRPLGEFIEDIVKRFVVQQHEWLGFEKGKSSSKIILHAVDDRLVATDRWDYLGVGNARFGNAKQMLKDLGLAEDDEEKIWTLTPTGQKWLDRELAREATP